MKLSNPIAALLAGAVLLTAPLDVFARIKLITLPVRERVEIQLDHAAATLIEEERIIPLLAGDNQIDFSWQSTQIDPQTIVFRVVEQTESPVNVLSVSYPPGENALVWSVSSAQATSARVRISYLLRNLSKNFHYRALANAQETHLTLSQYMRVINHANEAYDEASLWPGFGERIATTVDINQTKELLANKFRRVPIEKTYTADVVEFGYLDRAQDKLNVPMHYVLHNSTASGLGLAALDYGKVRIFQDDGRGGSAFVGEDWGAFTPIDDHMRLYLGLARDIVVKRKIEHFERERIKGNLFHFDITIKYEIENFKDSRAEIRIVEHLSALRAEIISTSRHEPEWELLPGSTLGEPVPEFSDQQKLVFSAPLPGRVNDTQTQVQTHQLRLRFNNEW